jgi:hypothetical protein
MKMSLGRSLNRGNICNEVLEGTDEHRIIETLEFVNDRIRALLGDYDTDFEQIIAEHWIEDLEHIKELIGG